MVLILVRHTTPLITPGACYGRTDVDVTDTFDVEAANVAAAMTGLVRIVTSPLKRCAKLADYLSKQTGAPVEQDRRLVEMDFGTWEGRLWSEIPKHELDEWADDFLNARPHGGENVAGLRRRTLKALSAIETLRGPTVVVTHSGVIRAALSQGDTADDFSANVPFGGIVQFETSKEMIDE